MSLAAPLRDLKKLNTFVRARAARSFTKAAEVAARHLRSSANI